MDDATVTMEETKPTQVNSAMDDEERMSSEHAFVAANINRFDVKCSTMRKNRDGDVKYLLCFQEGQTMSRT
nr:hypothetical protein Iba_chr03aCG2130 [Ipomoea batatas]